MTMPYSRACSGFRKKSIKTTTFAELTPFSSLLIIDEILKVRFSHHFDFAIHINIGMIQVLRRYVASISLDRKIARMETLLIDEWCSKTLRFE